MQLTVDVRSERKDGQKILRLSVLPNPGRVKMDGGSRPLSSMQQCSPKKKVRSETLLIGRPNKATDRH